MNINSEFPGEASRGTEPGLIDLKLRDQFEEFLGDIGQRRENYQPPLLPTLRKHLEREGPFFVNKQALYWWVVSDSGPRWRRSMDVFQRLDAEGIDVCLKALDDLWRAPGDDAARARVAAVEVLGSMGQLAPIEPLILALADPFWDVRAAAAQALGNMGEYTPVDFLTSLLELEKDESVGETIIRVLGRQGKRMPVSKLVKILRYDKSWMLRQAAAWALGELGPHAPIKWLGYALKHDEDECVRIAAVRSLGQTGKSQVKKMFYDALLDPEEEVREEVRKAIELLDTVSSSQQEHGDVSMFERLDSSSDTLSGEEADDEMVTNPASEPATGPGLFEGEGEESFQEELLQRWEGELSIPAKASPIWGESSPEQIIRLLTGFLKEKRGYLSRPTMLQTARGPVLLLTCFYQHSHTLQDIILPYIQLTTVTESIDDALRDQDEVITQIVKHTYEILEERTWIDWLVVSLELSRHSKWERGECVPLRVIVSGMSSQDIWKDDSLVLNQMVAAWTTTLKEPTVCQHPHDLINIKIWYQCAPDDLIEKEETVK
jgi:hypothetical protein